MGTVRCAAATLRRSLETTETWKHNDLETRRPGDTRTWRHEDLETRGPGDTTNRLETGRRVSPDERRRKKHVILLFYYFIILY